MVTHKRTGERIHIALTGLSGAGKTTVGKALADKLGAPFIDLDSCIESRLGKPISEVFSEQGEEAFRAIESEEIRVAFGSEERTLISLGGGALLSAVNQETVTSRAILAHLKVSVRIAAERLRNASDRPLLNSPLGPGTDHSLEKRLEVLYESRRIGFERAHVSIDTNELTIGEIVSQLTSKIVEFESREGR